MVRLPDNVYQRKISCMPIKGQGCPLRSLGSLIGFGLGRVGTWKMGLGFVQQNLYANLGYVDYLQLSCDSDVFLHRHMFDRPFYDPP